MSNASEQSRFLLQIRYWRKYYDNEASASRLFLNRSMENVTRLNEILPYWRYRVEWRYYNEAWIGTRLENMLPDTHYMVEVRAYNDAGFGPPGDICEMFTKKPRESAIQTRDLELPFALRLYYVIPFASRLLHCPRYITLMRL